MARDTQTLSVSLSAAPLYKCQTLVLFLPTNQYFLSKAGLNFVLSMRNWNFLMRIRSSVAWTEALWLFLFYIIKRIRSYVLEKPRRPCFNETGMIFKIASNQRGKKTLSPRNKILSNWPKILANMMFNLKTNVTPRQKL